MASHTCTRQQRAQTVVSRLNSAHVQLPAVLTSHDAIGLMGRTWFHESLRSNKLPGIQIVPQGVWRCDRDTFVDWLTEVSHDGQTPLGIAR